MYSSPTFTSHCSTNTHSTFNVATLTSASTFTFRSIRYCLSPATMSCISHIVACTMFLADIGLSLGVAVENNPRSANPNDASQIVAPIAHSSFTTSYILPFVSRKENMSLSPPSMKATISTVRFMARKSLSRRTVESSSSTLHKSVWKRRTPADLQSTSMENASVPTTSSFYAMTLLHSPCAVCTAARSSSSSTPPVSTLPS